MIATFPTFSPLKISHKNQFMRITQHYEPYAEFSFPCLFSWDTDGTTAISQLNGNLVIRMPDYVTSEPLYSVIGKKKIDETLDTLLETIGELKLVPEVVINEISKPRRYTVTEDRDQFDYVYLLSDQVELMGKHFKGRRNKSSKFLSTYIDRLELRKINFKDDVVKDEVKDTFKVWMRDRHRTKKDVEHEEIALSRILDNAPEFNLIGIQIFIDGNCVGFSINEVVSEEYAVCRFHKSLVGTYNYIDAFFSNLVAIELQHFGCKYISWEQDLGIEGLRSFKESYKPYKYLKKYTITKG